jgi:hypothetical protein
MENKIYWFTNSDIDDIDFYDKSLNIENQIYAPPSIFDKIKSFFKKSKSAGFKSNKNIDFDDISATVLLKPIERTEYEVVTKGKYPFLIYIFKYHLFEEKFASKIMAVSNNRIQFDKVSISENGQLYKAKTYFRLKESLKEIKFEDCKKIKAEKDEIFLTSGSYLYFSASLKLKLDSFVKENYPTYQFVPGIPYFIC